MILGEVFPGEDAHVLVEAIKNDYSGEDEDTIQDLVVWVKHYKQTEEQATGATAVWNSNMGQYDITIPAAYVPASGIFDACVKGSDIEDILIRLQVVPNLAQIVETACGDALAEYGASTLTTVNLSDLATSAEITALNNLSSADVASAISAAGLATAAGLSGLNNLSEAQVLAQVASALNTYDAPTKEEMDAAFATTNGLIGVTASVGAEKIIPHDYYTLDAEAKTITLLSPYNTLTVEQVKFIKDIDANYIIYDDREKSYEELPISIADGVLTYTAPAANTVNGNAIQISINM
jgi:hypothetical protein